LHHVFVSKKLTGHIAALGDELGDGVNLSFLRQFEIFTQCNDPLKLGGVSMVSKQVSLDVQSPEYWDSRAEKYDEDFSASEFRVRALRELAQLVVPQPHQRLLDIGSGTGRSLVPFLPDESTQKPWFVVGVDLSLRMLHHAQLTAPNAAFVQAYAAHLPFRSQTFDWIVSSMCFHHLPPVDKELLAGELRRIVRPSGQVVFVDEMIMTDSHNFGASDILELMLNDFYPHLSVEEGHKRFKKLQEWPISSADWLDILQRHQFHAYARRISDMIGIIVAQPKITSEVSL
jgi:ubiquinone/menaquinone biosynthesis C-methylase UbiE